MAFGCRNAPIGEAAGDPRVQIAGRAMILDLAPGCTAGAGHIHRRYARLRKRSNRLFEKPQPTSLAMTGTPVGADSFNFGQQAGEVDIAFRLHRLLQHVEMQDQGIGADHIDRPAALIQAVAII